MSLRSMIAALQQSQIDFVVVGGVAASAHGSSHVTNDLDICYSTAHDNIVKLVNLLHQLGAELRGADPNLPFIIDTRTFCDSPFLTLTTTEGYLDLLDQVPGIGGYPEARAVSEPIDWDRSSFYSLSLSSLIDAKRAAGRRKDREHLIELEAIRDLQKPR